MLTQKRMACNGFWLQSSSLVVPVSTCIFCGMLPLRLFTSSVNISLHIISAPGWFKRNIEELEKITAIAHLSYSDDSSIMTQHDFLLKQATSAVHEMSFRIPMLLVDILCQVHPRNSPTELFQMAFQLICWPKTLKSQGWHIKLWHILLYPNLCYNFFTSTYIVHFGCRRKII